jgi:ferric-dicitrate binding protein FerR (iron transport regulator)
MDINVIITKFLLRDISKQEIRVLRHWISQDPANRKHLEEIEKIYHAIEVFNNPDNIDPGKAWKMIEAKMSPRVDLNTRLTPIEKPGRRVNYRKGLLVAASFFLAISLSIVGSYLYFMSKNKTEIAFNEINVPQGSKSSIILSDGSKIWLNSSTSLKYPEKFEPGFREVYLEGEAFFDIAEDKDKPFFVRTSDLNIKVLGTSFNVKSYANEGTIETTLESGSISIHKELEGKKSDLVLKPNQRLTFVKKKGIILVDDIKSHLEENKSTPVSTERKVEKIYLDKNIDTKLYTSWKDNKLVFNDETFESLVIKIERWYNVKIIIQGEKLKQYRFSGTFENETVEQALNALQITTKFQYTLKQNIITIKYY